ncbi:hypothetical protein Tco_0393555 [Tanacetum coccineum]
MSGSKMVSLTAEERMTGREFTRDRNSVKILISHDERVLDSIVASIETHKALLKDEEAEDVDVHLYRSMIGSLMYLTASRPDIIYLKGQPKLGLWYPIDSLFDLEAFSNSDYTGAILDRKILIGCHFWQKAKHIEYMVLNASPLKSGRVTKETSQSGWFPEKVGDEAVHKELGDRMERAATTASSLEVEQDSEGSEGFHQIVDFLNSTHIKYALTENPTIYVSLIHQFWQTASASTSENGEMEITATIDGRVKTVTEASIRRHLKLEDYDEKNEVESLESDLKQTKLTYGAAYTKLIMKVKKLENRIKSSKARRRVRLIVLEDEEGAQTQRKHEHNLEPDFEFTAPEEVYTAKPDISTANVPVSTAAKRKDKGKAIMKEAEPVQKKTKLQLEQERLGYEEALRLQEQLDEEERHNG